MEEREREKISGEERERGRASHGGGRRERKRRRERNLTLCNSEKLGKEGNLEEKYLGDQSPRSADEAETPSPEVRKGLEEDIRVLRLIRDGKLSTQESKDELGSLMKLLEELEGRQRAILWKESETRKQPRADPRSDKLETQEEIEDRKGKRKLEEEGDEREINILKLTHYYNNLGRRPTCVKNWP